jgi:hypothetical protein
VTWHDVKAKARATDLTGDSPERVARRQKMREQMLAAQKQDHPRAKAGLDLTETSGRARPR